MAAPLIIGQTQRAELAALRELAHAMPQDVQVVMVQCRTPTGHALHLEAMKPFTIPLPTAFMVTFTLEIGHPAGLCRHLSMSSLRHSRTPTPEAVWMVAQELGFQGSIQDCAFWLEDIGSGDAAVNIVQPVAS
jgi:hypothetical protein